MDFRSQEIIELIDRCFAEDIGSGDHSSLAAIAQGTVGESRLLLKQDGVIAGLELGEVILRRLDPNSSPAIICILGPSWHRPGGMCMLCLQESV